MIDPVFAYLTGIIITLIYSLIAVRKKVPKRRIMLTSVFILYMTAVLSLTFFPLVYDKACSPHSNNTDNNIRLIPFEVISAMIKNDLPEYALIQIGGNLVMTIPFGFAVIPLIGNRVKKHAVAFYICLAYAFPVCIELMQLLIGSVFRTFYRTCDIDDVILNSTGVLIGYALFLIARRIYRNNKKIVSEE